MNPFEFIKSITTTKEDIMTKDNEKDYNPFIVNRSLSYFQDTLFLANEMNLFHSSIPNSVQYAFYLNSIVKKSRFAKWAKPVSSESLEIVKAYYGYNNELAKIALALLSNEQINELKKRLKKGGTKNI